MPATGFSPLCSTECGPPVSVADAEALLSEWFERPVVVTSSGRAALLLCFRQLGLQRYDSRIAMSPRTAQCVFDAVTRAAFPVDPASDQQPVDATLLIHQYGHVQIDRPSGGTVVEDICHAFFASPSSGSRNWAGDMAVFSLPKFFPMAGMGGGIVAASEGLAEELRERRDVVPQLTEGQRDADRAQLRSGDTALLEQLYLRALLHPAACPLSLAGLPSDLGAVGRAREKVVTAILGALPQGVLEESWRVMCGANLPFAIPVFGEPGCLAALVAELRSKGIESGLFRIDSARRMAAPDMQVAALLPCHDHINEPEVAVLTNVLKAWAARLPISSAVQ